MSYYILTFSNRFASNHSLIYEAKPIVIVLIWNTPDEEFFYTQLQDQNIWKVTSNYIIGYLPSNIDKNTGTPI